MLEWIRGPLARREADHVIVEVGGVGLRIAVPATTPSLGEPGDEVTLLTALAIQEAEPKVRLYGFASEPERALFEALRGVSGIGAALSLKILSGMAPARIAAAIGKGDVATLSTIKGLGEKRAEVIVAKLRRKIGSDALLCALAAAQGEALPAPAQPRRRRRGRAARAAEVTAEVAQSGLGRQAEDAVRALVRLELEPDAALVLVERAVQTLGADASAEDLIRESLRTRT